MANKRHMRVYRVEIVQDNEVDGVAVKWGTCKLTIYLAAPNLDAAKAWLLDYTLKHNVTSLVIFCISGLSFYTEKTREIILEGGVWQYGSLNVCVDQAPMTPSDHELDKLRGIAERFPTMLDNHPNAY